MRRLLNRPAPKDPFASWSRVCAFFLPGFVLEAAERGPHRFQERHRLGQPLGTQPVEVAVAGETERATLVIAEDGESMTAEWERTDDGSNWRHWTDMSFVRPGRRPPVPPCG
ncbi:hypothetical protein [Actinomadura mexicana]|uniref:hypothetical protein n=1 Tax=Actinomadura mexicana TaxID=134959 RepID=UPI001FE38B3F|nr:hypothetical protein [Actinomadura mexicana]